jgi:murein L,D-transpeptidase YafK
MFNKIPILLLLLLLTGQNLHAMGSRSSQEAPSTPNPELPSDSYCHQLTLFSAGPIDEEELIGSADQIVVDKSRQLLHLLQDDHLMRSYNIAMGANPVGHKREQGDERTPEGNYLIEYKNPNSKYHLSLAIDYPNPQDQEYARANGFSPGGDIMIHGLPNKWWRRMFVNHPENNWTDGCIAVTNEEIQEIWDFVEAGTKIELCP